VVPVSCDVCYSLEGPTFDWQLQEVLAWAEFAELYAFEGRGVEAIAFALSMAACSSTAQATAFTVLPNSTTPVSLTMRPRLETAG
jgi:hypothetical protein